MLNCAQIQFRFRKTPIEVMEWMNNFITYQYLWMFINDRFSAGYADLYL